MTPPNTSERGWTLEFYPGGPLEGAEAEAAVSSDCEPFELAVLRIASVTETEAGKRYNPKTRAFDIPIGRTIVERVFDPRREDAEKIRAELTLAAAAPEMADALETADSWLERWASHIGSCAGGDQCTCGLTRVRYETSAALARAQGQ